MLHCSEKDSSDKSYIDLSADFLQKTRYAYGYNTEVPFEFLKKDIRLNYYDVGGKFSVASLNLDSADLSYDLGLSYDFFQKRGYRIDESFRFYRQNVKSLSGILCRIRT